MSRLTFQQLIEKKAKLQQLYRTENVVVAAHFLLHRALRAQANENEFIHKHH